MDVIAELWARLTQTHPAPPDAVVVISALAAAAAVLVTVVWRRTRHVVTIAHEGGHALAALLTGRRLKGIRLHSDTSGVTMTRGKPTGPGAVLTLLAGYLTPALLGLAAAGLITAGRVVLLLWLTLGLLAAMALFVRNVYGFLAVFVVGGLVFAASWYGTPQVQTAVAYGGAWFLLLGSLRPLAEVTRQRRSRRAVSSDPDQLADITKVPAVLWLLAFALGAGAAAALGGKMLLDPLL